MDLKKSIVLPIGLAIVISGLIFGGLGYYLAKANRADISDINSTHSALITTSPTAKATATTVPTITPNISENWRLWASVYSSSFKTPITWRAMSADNDAASLVSVYDEGFKDSLFLKGQSGAAYRRLSLYYAYQGPVMGHEREKTPFTTWVKSAGGADSAPTVTESKSTTLNGQNAVYQVENQTSAVYYVELDSVYLKISYSLTDSQKKNIEEIIKTLKFNTSETDIKNATSVNDWISNP